ncbi:centrosomal protein of 76 kDa-like [Sycon ciliatum]|uniref:centrosomal protein of 76 kDa-like n=1 Tax=Sycon ciliatum TaxID=27933 RepID=UPI0031F6549A
MAESDVQPGDVSSKEDEERFIDAVVERLRHDAAAAKAVSVSNVFGAERDAFAGITSDSQGSAQFIRLRVLGGRGFANEICEEERSCTAEERAQFVLHCQFASQRLTAPAVPCSAQPALKHDYIFTLPVPAGQHAASQHSASTKAMPTAAVRTGDGSRSAESPLKDRVSSRPVHSAADLLENRQLLHLVLVRTSKQTDPVLQSSHHLAWRTVLSSPEGYSHCYVELHGVYSESNLPIGVLEVELQLMPPPRGEVSAQVLSSQLEYEYSCKVEADTLLMNYVKQWWKDYLGVRSSHGSRHVKLFVKDENGDSHMVCSLLRPLRAGREISSPRQAARFVSLFPYTSTPWMDGGAHHDSSWTSCLAFVSRKHGGCEEHAILLCSLLLGFGLNAFVCVGTQVNHQYHVWVATIDEDSGQTTFWESLTGQRCVHEAGGKSSKHIYATIGCVFNHCSCFANMQPSDKVQDCVFALGDKHRWKAVSLTAIQSATRRRDTPALNLPSLRPATLNAPQISARIEQDLISAIHQHRKRQGLTCDWDMNLGYMLTPALESYEHERCSGLSYGNEEFQMAIRHYVKEGITFKAFPVNFAHSNPARMLDTCLQSPVGQDILDCRGDEVKFSVRVLTCVYAEDLCAVWVMLAVLYRSVL